MGRQRAFPAGQPSNDPMAMMRAQMDEMMGKNRNVALDEQKTVTNEEAFNDPKLDKFHLCGCSPYDLLKGTKSEQMPQLGREGFLLERSEMLKMRSARHTPLHQ